MSFRQLFTHRDVLAGLFFLSVGLAVIAIASRYSFGTAMRMGLGYFPIVLGALLALLGVATALKGLRTNHALDHVHFEPMTWRPPLLISGGVLLFAATIQFLGLAVAAFDAVTLMKHRLKTPEGKALYAQRKTTSEPVFGIIRGCGKTSY